MSVTLLKSTRKKVYKKEISGKLPTPNNKITPTFNTSCDHLNLLYPTSNRKKETTNPLIKSAKTKFMIGTWNCGRGLSE